jgi:hypothetical protein
MDQHERATGRPLGGPLLWILRAAWLAQPLASATYGDALDGRSGAVQWTAAIALWTGWGLVLIALLVPAVATLTVVRMAVPAAVIVSVWAVVAGGSGVAAATAIALAVLCSVVAFSGDVGQVFVQASAYGAEQRLLLRPPAAWLILVTVTWALAAAGVLAGLMVTAAGTWWLGPPVLVVGTLVAWLGGVRIHRLSRRWLVFVPAGLVVHDHVVLSDAHLYRTIDVAGVHLAFADTGAADFTGGALGPALEITLVELNTVVLAATPAEPRGKALHVRAMLISPTRPGRALTLAAEAKLPIA